MRSRGRNLLRAQVLLQTIQRSQLPGCASWTPLPMPPEAMPVAEPGGAVDADEVVALRETCGAELKGA
jgi:hypothetical protein